MTARSMLVRVAAPTTATALVSSAMAVAVNLATEGKASWWAWLAVAALTVIIFCVSLWLYRRRLYWLQLRQGYRESTEERLARRYRDGLREDLNDEIHFLEASLKRAQLQAEKSKQRERDVLLLRQEIDVLRLRQEKEVSRLRDRIEGCNEGVESLRAELRSLYSMFAEIASTIPDGSAGVRSAVRIIPLAYYTSSNDPGAAAEVEKAISAVVESSGFTPIWTGDRESGSIFRKFFASSNRVLASEEARDAVKKIERAVELQALHIPQSQADSALAEGVSRLLTALDGSDTAFVQLGSVILLKVDRVPIVFNLTQLELSSINREPALFRDPRALLEKLRSLRNNVDDASPDSSLGRLSPEGVGPVSYDHRASEGLRDGGSAGQDSQPHATNGQTEDTIDKINTTDTG